ncbi:MAG TPA: lmo0937 family membrane protein [Pyrinomonadaceae bacterium]
MALWVIAVLLVLGWSIGMVLHKSGFIHILLLCAIAIIVVQLVAGRRAV